jgi:hypothetical protein
MAPVIPDSTAAGSQATPLGEAPCARERVARHLRHGALKASRRDESRAGSSGRACADRCSTPGSKATAARSLDRALEAPARRHAYMSGFRFGLVVMGTIRPPRTTCGMSAIGVSAIAASADATNVERRSPSAVAFIASATEVAELEANALGPPLKPSAKNTMPSSIAHWTTQNEAQQGVLREHVVEEPQVHHALAQVDRALGHDLARRVARAEPDAADDDEEHRRRVVGRRLHRVQQVRRPGRHAPFFFESSCSAPRHQYGTGLLPPKTTHKRTPMTGAWRNMIAAPSAVANLDLPVARGEKPELADGRDGGAVRDAAGPGRRRARGAPSTSSGRADCRSEELGPPRLRRLESRVASGRAGFARASPRARALAHVEHVEHVARVVDRASCGSPRRRDRSEEPVRASPVGPKYVGMPP